MEAPVMYDAFGEATKAIKTTGFFIALLLELGAGPRWAGPSEGVVTETAGSTVTATLKQ
jgi:hypothetical protein